MEKTIGASIILLSRDLTFYFPAQSAFAGTIEIKGSPADVD
jgi:hypothetical protein